MRAIRIIPVYLLSLFGFALKDTCANEEALDTPAAREVLLNHYRAYGGRTVVSSLFSLRFEGKTAFPGQEARPFRLHKKRPNLFRYELDLNEKQTWLVSSYGGRFNQQMRVFREYQEPTEITDSEQIAFLQSETQFAGYLWNLRTENRTVEIYPQHLESRLQSYLCKVFEYEPATGETGALLAEVVLDPKTYYVRERIIPLQGEHSLRSVFGDYREVEEIPFPFLIKNYFDDTLAATTTLETVKVNPGTLDLFFKLRP